MFDVPGAMPFPSCITDAVDQAMLARRRAEEDATTELLCDVLSGWDELHKEIPTANCRDIFSDVPCRLDDWRVLSVARHG